MVRRLLTLEPWQEEAHRQLMELLVLRGRRTEALMQYKTVPADADAGTGRGADGGDAASLPGPGVRPAPPGWAVRPLGQRVLGPRHNLPPQPMPIHGRQAEMAQLKRLLLGGDCRLLSLVGAGGVGKTRLALAVAEDVREHFGDGVWYVPLADVWQERQPPLGWGAGAGKPPAGASGPQPDSPRQRGRGVPAGRHRSRAGAGDVRPAPLGCCQCWPICRDGGCSSFWTAWSLCSTSPACWLALLAATAQTRLLVTCRRRLDLRGEQAVRIGRLEVPAARSRPTRSTWPAWPACRSLAPGPGACGRSSRWKREMPAKWRRSAGPWRACPCALPWPPAWRTI